MMSDNIQKNNLKTILNIDKTIHEPARLLIMTHLYILESVDFIFLINHTGLTQGNLSSHLTKLENAGYIKIKKEFVGRRPHTILKMTPLGRKSFQEYRQNMRSALDNQPD